MGLLMGLLMGLFIHPLVIMGIYIYIYILWGNEYNGYINGIINGNYNIMVYINGTIIGRGVTGLWLLWEYYQTSVWLWKLGMEPLKVRLFGDVTTESTEI